MALVEAKVGKVEISAEQLERYLELAKKNKMDAVITVSNQFSVVPQHHPVRVNMTRYKGIQLFHFSWMHILTEADLLTVNRDVEDDDQAFILSEFRRFISHESAGVQGFTQMPRLGPRWSPRSKREVHCNGQLMSHPWLKRGSSVTRSVPDTYRQLKRQVSQRLSRAALADPEVRVQGDVNDLCGDQCLRTSLIVPNAAARDEVRIRPSAPQCDRVYEAEGSRETGFRVRPG